MKPLVRRACSLAPGPMRSRRKANLLAADHLKQARITDDMVLSVLEQW